MAKILRFFFLSTVVFATLFFIFFNLYLKNVQKTPELLKQLTDVKQKLQNLKSENFELLQKLKLKESEISDLKLKYENEVSNLKTILENKEKSIKSLDSQIENLKTEIKKLQETGNVESDYYSLIKGDIELSKGNFVRSAEYFSKVDIENIDLGGLKAYYKKRRSYSFEKAGRELYLRGFESFKSKKYQEAVNYFLMSSKYSNRNIYYYDDLLYYLGIAYLKIDNYVESLRVLKELLHTYQFSDYIDEALLKVAEIYESLGDFENAIFYYKVLKSYGYKELANKKIRELEKKLKR